MCGIIFIKRFDGLPALRMVEKRYWFQRRRGTEGYGFIAIENNEIEDYWRCEIEKDMLAQLRKLKSPEIFLHHRNPTSTPNFWETAHPLWISHDTLKYDYYVMHNGIIYNDTLLRGTHEKMGFPYRTEITQEWKTKDNRTQTILKKFNDSESMAIELAISIDQGGEGIPGVRGSIAFVALQVEKGEKGKTIKTFWGRNSSNPLVFKQTKSFLSVTSEGGVNIEGNVLFDYDYAANKISQRPFTLEATTWVRKDWGREEREPMGFRHPTENALGLPAPTSKIDLLLKENDIIIPDADTLDVIADLPIVNDKMGQDAILDAIIDLNCEQFSLEKSIDSGVHKGDYQAFLIERLAHVEERVALANKLMVIAMKDRHYPQQ